MVLALFFLRKKHEDMVFFGSPKKVCTRGWAKS